MSTDAEPVSLRASGGAVVLNVATGAVCGVVALGLLARNMTSADFVSLAALTPVIAVMSVLGRFGFDRLAIRHYWHAPEGARAASVLRYVRLGLLGTAVVAAIALVTGRLLDSVLPDWARLDTRTAVFVFAWTLGETARSITADLPRSWGRDLLASVIGNGGRNVLWLGAVIVASLRSEELSLTAGVGLAALASVVVGVAGVAQLARRARDEVVVTPVQHRIEGPVVRSGLAVAALLVSGILVAQFDVVVVGGNFASDTGASYAIASRIATTFALSLVALTGLLPSLLGRLDLLEPEAPDPDRQSGLRATVALVTTIACAATFAGMVVFAIVGRPLLVHGLGPEFEEAYGLALVMLAGQAINVLTGATGTMLILLGEESHVAAVGVTAAVITVAAELAAVQHGVYWVAIASSAALALPSLWYTAKLHRDHGFTGLPSLRRSTLRAGLARVRASQADAELASATNGV